MYIFFNYGRPYIVPYKHLTGKEFFCSTQTADSVHSKSTVPILLAQAPSHLWTRRLYRDRLLRNALTTKSVQQCKSHFPLICSGHDLIHLIPTDSL